MRFVAPRRDAIDARVFERPPLALWAEFAPWLRSAEFPPIAALNARVAPDAPRFVAQTPALLADGLHYERRIAERGEIATRDDNWHDLFNAMAWLRHAAMKRALNARQVAEIAQVGDKRRSRAQYALTHFDEAGVIVLLRDPLLLALWDTHDWHGLFWRERTAWQDGRAEVGVFGHALLEHALVAGQLLVGKALVVTHADAATTLADAIAATARAVQAGTLLNDPLELRPLPLSGIPGWHAQNGDETFHLQAACYQARREGRRYPAPLAMARADGVARVRADQPAVLPA